MMIPSFIYIFIHPFCKCSKSCWKAYGYICEQDINPKYQEKSSSEGEQITMKYISSVKKEKPRLMWLRRYREGTAALLDGKGRHSPGYLLS